MYSKICSSFSSVFFWYSSCFNSTLLILSNKSALLAINSLISTNARIIPMLTLIATSLCNTLASIDILCSVNTYGSVRLPPRPSFFPDSCIFEVPDWHFKDSASSVVIWKQKSSGNRFMFQDHFFPFSGCLVYFQKVLSNCIL